MNQTRLRFLWRENGFARQFRTGVSLHRHTMHSLESLGFIPRYAEAVPPLASLIHSALFSLRHSFCSIVPKQPPVYAPYGYIIVEWSHSDVTPPSR